MSAQRDMAQLLATVARAPAPSVRLLRGTVQAWDGTSGHRVRVAGADLTGLPILASAGTPTAGDVVAVLQAGHSFLILGKITT